MTDGTRNGTSFLDESALDLTDVDGELFYEWHLRPGTLAKSDGTRAGTGPVFAPSGGSTKISHLHAITAVGAHAFFVAGDGLGGITGQELWVSDGTTDGSSLVKDINPSGKSYPSDLTDVNGVLLFRATTRQAGAELWRSDGTADGTTLVDDLRPGTGSGAPSQITPMGDSVYFRANDGVHGAELWRSDGTSAGTEMVDDIA